MKFIHAADIHLGHLFQGIKKISVNLQDDFINSTFNAFIKVINTAIDENVDFVILAGDEYDRHRRSLKEQNFLREQFIRLKENNINIFLVYGNHDYLINESTFIDFPDNVYSFGKEVETFNILSRENEEVSISGFSYGQQHISKNYLPNFPEKKSSEDYHIGILHGMISSISEDYAPFSISEMLSKGYDYWALGHIHKREVINEHPPIVYSGDIQGLNRTETGEKGFYLVDMNKGHVDMKFISSQIYLWNSISINIEKNFNIDNVKNEIMNNLDGIENNTLLSVNIDNMQNLDKKLQEQVEDDDFLNYIQGYLNDKKIYIYKIKPIYKIDKLYDDIDKDYWNKSKKEVFTVENIESLDKKIKNYDFVKDHIENENYIDEIIQKTSGMLNHKKEQ